MSTIDVTYDLTCPPGDAREVARKIALEQTVEVPEDVLLRADLAENIVGQVASIEPLPGQPPRCRAIIRFNTDLASFQLPQLLNLIYGNISIQNGIRIVDLRLPDELTDRFNGPSFGTNGIRALLGVHERPLLATALKPRGATVEHLASIARNFALGGGDIVKDDHNLVDTTFEAFKARVTRCAAAVHEANQQTGRATLYLPNLLPPIDQLDRHVEFLLGLGIRGVLVCPYLLGVDVMRRLAEQYPLVIMAHPALSGTFFHDPAHGIAPDVALGTLMRLAGADMTVFPNAGGRFSFPPEHCAAISRAMQRPLGRLKPGLPVPAGGMRFELLPRMAEMYGAEAVFLIGGALLSHCPSIRDSTRAFQERIAESFTPRLTEPQGAAISSCELPTGDQAPELAHHLKFSPDFTWTGRLPTDYKAPNELPFRDIVRHELLGRSGEQSASDLRYFEIAPGGYSSLEKHRHTHAIICVRGHGVLVLDNERITLAPFDVAHVPPLAIHQLRNESDQPLGFFCIVDHTRDRPQAP